MGLFISYIDRLKLTGITLGALRHPDAFIDRLSHRILTYQTLSFHRILATGKNHGVSGVGVSHDLHLAQMAAIMECVERDHFYAHSKRPTTNGMSCALEEDRARTAALLELVERDQVLLTIFFSPVLRVLSPQVLGSVRFFYMTLDLPVHVVMAEITSAGESRSYGFGCDFDVSRAKDKAFREALVIFDSRDVPVSSERGVNSLHILPFVQPGVTSSNLPLFRADDRPVELLNEADLPSFSHDQLKNTMDTNGMAVSFEITKKRIFPLLSAVICQAHSSHLQDLFFSDTDIRINRQRSDMLRYPQKPRYYVLHPIG